MSALVKYKSVLIKLEEEIRSGKYAKSTLPSEAQLVKRFCVGRKTVQRAILELQHRGLVVRHQGRGTFLTKQGKKSTGLLGLLVPESSYSTMFHTLVRELARVGQSAGYTFLFGCASEGDAQAIIEQTYKFAKEFVEHRVEGVIFRPLVDERRIDVNLNVIKIIRDAGIPIVLIDSDVVASPLRSDFDIVGINNIVAGQRIARHLLEQGRKQIAFIMDASPLGLSINLRTRLFGLTGEIIAAGAKWDKRHLFITGADEVNKIKRILGRSFRPDAIVCANDEVAIRLMHTLQLIGIRVPEDIAVIGCDDIESGRMAKPSLSTIHQPVAKIAELAFATLQKRIQGDSLPPCEIFVEAPLMERESTLIEKKRSRMRR